MKKGGYSGLLTLGILRQLRKISKGGFLEFAIFQIPRLRSAPMSLGEVPALAWSLVQRSRSTLLKVLVYLSLGHGTHVHYTDDINNDASVNAILRAAKSDFLVNRGGRIVSTPTLAAFTGSWINIHGGILPKYRGLDSHLWAASKLDFSNVGVTAHIMGPKIDQGQILIKRFVDVNMDQLICAVSKALDKASDELHLRIHADEGFNKASAVTDDLESQYFGPMKPRPLPWQSLKDVQKLARW